MSEFVRPGDEEPRELGDSSSAAESCTPDATAGLGAYYSYGSDDEAESSESVGELKSTSGDVVEAQDIAIEKDLAKALEEKEIGNNLYKAKDYNGAIQSYSNAIMFCPTDEENKETLATFYGNRSAAYFSVEEWECVIEDCKKAVELKPDYVKVIFRRCQANEKAKKTSDALEDAKKVLELAANYPGIQSTVLRLEKLHAQEMEELKTKAMGQLKDLGNMFLKNFGMSVDDFKMQQDPKTGGWNLSMGQGGGQK